jgi:flagellar biosynthetic protein FliP
MMRALMGILVALVLCAGAGLAQTQPGPAAPATGTPHGPPPPPWLQGPPTAPSGPALTLHLAGGTLARDNLGSAVEIVLLMTLLALAPAIVMTMTSFTRIVIVLSFLKRAMSMQDLPPGLVVTGFATFMTVFVMRPVVTDVYDRAYTPYVEGRIDWREAADIAAARMNEFMLKQTRDADVALILELSRTPPPATMKETPFHVTVPAFVLSEIKTAFQMGFVLFLPFVVIDLVISSILVSMGMFTLPPIVVSTPLKLLLFILVGGWDLVVLSLAESFAA